MPQHTSAATSGKTLWGKTSAGKAASRENWL